jgi:dTMP kinase
VAYPGSLLLVVEGLDGAGKTTQIERLVAFLTAAGATPVVTREPGGTPVGERIRDILLDSAHTGLSPTTEALLYAADRAQHVEEVIRPALAAGRVVVSDRYLDSSLAYQGLARGLGVEEVLEVNLWGTGGLLPDLVLLLDVPAELGRSRSEGADRIEREAETFHLRVAQAYWALSRTYPSRFAVVDAAGAPDAVAAEVRRRVAPLLERAGPATVSRLQHGDGSQPPGAGVPEPGRQPV